MLIDTHTHLESFHRKGVLPVVLANARESGIGALVTIGTSTDDWALYRSLAAAHRGFVHYAVGLHPCSVDENWEREVSQIEPFWTAAIAAVPAASATNAHANFAAATAAATGAESTSTSTAAAATAATVAAASAPPVCPAENAPPPVALGECGLDRFHLPKDDAPRAARVFEWQRAAFAAQLRIARQLACPVVVHSRGAFAECVRMIDESGVDWARVVFHCFTEGAPEMRELARRGGRGSFTGVLTYKSAAPVREAALEQGLSRFMVETDAPYLAPEPRRGKTNEPAFARHTAERAAALFGVPFEELARASTQNARMFFGL